MPDAWLYNQCMRIGAARIRILRSFIIVYIAGSRLRLCLKNYNKYTYVCECIIIFHNNIFKLFFSSFLETPAEIPIPLETPIEPSEPESTLQPVLALIPREKKAPRPPKKKYQRAGLYSDVYKTTE